MRQEAKKNPESSIASPPSPVPSPVSYTQIQKEQAARWFSELRDKICTEFEKIEQEYQEFRGCGVSKLPSNKVSIAQLRNSATPQPVFTRKNWNRQTPDHLPGGGGVTALMKGRVFEKVGVNVSAVDGHFSPEFRQQIPGAEKDGLFWASGISLVAHPANPYVPAAHMNTRCIVTSKSWFGGGADLTPVFPDAAETKQFHAALQKACDAHGADIYARYKKWCDEYFFIPHRGEVRGAGGIFFDNHNSGSFDSDFAFTREVGLAFLDIYPQLVRASMFREFGEQEREAQLIKRGRYAEFNLIYDRGTKFGLMTGGNVDAILMSLPPEAKWP